MTYSDHIAKHIFLGSALCASALLLAACSSGGGGGGSSSNSLSSIIGVPEPTVTSDRVITELSANGDDIKVQIDRNTDEIAELYVNGDLQDEGSYGDSPSGGVYTVDGVSKAFAFDWAPNDWLSEGETIGSRSDANWEYSGVEYDYIVGEKGGEPKVTEGEDGTIDYDGTAWSATFGDVTLEGSLSGSTVSGTASFGEMTGKFKGYDGAISTEGGNTYFDSWGAFAGDNGSDSSFAGGWE